MSPDMFGMNSGARKSAGVLCSYFKYYGNGLQIGLDSLEGLVGDPTNS